MSIALSHSQKRAGRIIVATVVTIIGLGGVGQIQSHVDSIREAKADYEMLYFPNEKLIRHLTAGLDNVIADFMWYRTVQYTAKEFRSKESKFVWLEHMTGVVTTLDPHHLDGYRYGGLFLALIGAEDLAVPILQEGFKNNPMSWELPYELHTIYLLSAETDPANTILASHYAMMVAERHEDRYKEFYVGLAQNLLSGSDRHDDAIELLTLALNNTKDPFLRQQAEAKLLEAIIAKNLSVLNKSAEVYNSRFGRKISSVDDLVTSGLIAEFNASAEEGDYFLDTNGAVRNSVVVHNYETRMGNKIRRHVTQYRNKFNEAPATLDDVAEFMSYRSGRYSYLLPDSEWYFDPATDEVTVRVVPPTE
jgi:hypothetical protein